MKNKIPTILLAISLTTLFGFDVGQEIELDSFLNARTNPNFLKTTKNIKTTLAKGTTGEVSEIKNFSSGNAGIKMKVTSGPKAGQSYWVYYNASAPAIKLVNKKTEKEFTSIKEIKHEDLPIPSLELTPVEAETKENVPGTRDLEEAAIEQASQEVLSAKVEVKETVEQAIVKASSACNELLGLDRNTKEIISRLESYNDEEEEEEAIPMVLNRGLASTSSSAALETVPERQFNGSQNVEPYRDVPGPNLMYSICSSVEGNYYSVCKRQGQVDSFKLQNYGPNEIVAKTDYYINRTYEFEFSGRARSDMKLLVTDNPDSKVSHSGYSIMMFFPRSVLPSVKKVGDELVVTLPNKEIVKYDAATKEIIGGVLSEKPVTQNSVASMPAVSYSGAGVMIKANKIGDLPYGNVELPSGKEVPSTTTATISKKGFPDCKVPSKDIWYNDDAKKDVLIKTEYQTDAGLDAFLKKQCGFSLF